MTINPQAQGHSSIDVLQGSVTNHFAQIESVLLQNECINGQYNLITSAAYAANCPVDAPGFTKVCFSTNGTIISDLENSYIEATLTYDLQYKGWDKGKAVLPKPGDGSALSDPTKVSPITKFFIGFKQSLDALERYDVYCNSTLLYSQPFVGPESTIMLAGINDTILNNSPFVYSSFNNASTMDANVCGVYVDLKEIAENTTFKVQIPVKINLHQFLLLTPIHYLPSFCGRWELQLYFGSKNLVICPVNPKSYFNNTMAPGDWDAAVDDNKKFKVLPNHFEHFIDMITHTIYTQTHQDAQGQTVSSGFTRSWANHFTQINCPMNAYNWDVGTKKPVFTDFVLSCTNTRLESCLMNTTQFQLKGEVYQALLQHYMEAPMIIPTNTLSYQRFAHSSSNTDTLVQATANLPVENLDSLFFLLPHNDNQTTCYYQPYLTAVRVGLGEFGIRPQRYMDTFDYEGNGFNNRRFITYLLDALNLESSQISAMSKDFSNSVLPHASEFSGAAGNMTRTSRYTVQNRYDKQYDNSNFMIGIPLSQVGFQSGTVSSPMTNINIQFDANAVPPPKVDTQYDLKVIERKSGGIIGMFLTDCSLIIQVVPGSNQPVIKLTSRSIV